jgi:peptidoglycan/xylan/chitin deacetylase (PgdA/CDA1 family)
MTTVTSGESLTRSRVSRMQAPKARALARSRAGWLARYARLRASALRAGLVLVYHKLGDPPGDPERELVPALDPTLFDDQLAHLVRWYRVVPAVDIQAAASARRRGERFPVAISFDDDLRSHAEVAMPALRRAGLPATFLLSGASLDGPHRFWWERLQAAADQGVDLAAAVGSGLQPEGHSIHGWALAIESSMPGERRRVAAALEERIGPDPPDSGMRRADVVALVDAGFDVGFHTLRHDPLPLLDDPELASALREGRGELEGAVGRPVRWISYPHGKGDARVAAAAREAGYDRGFTGAAEAVRPASDPLLLPRVEVEQSSPGGFARQLVAVLEPALDIS